MNTHTAEAEIRVGTPDVREDLSFFTKKLGFRLDQIFPADYPRVAVLSGYGVRLRIDRDATEAPVTLRILCDDPGGFADGDTELTAPNGMRIKIAQIDPPMETPETEHAFVVRRLRDNAPWVIGRAGMHYRDLVPSRLGGSIIASHIRIPDGGPVPDMVHYHTVGFQLIFCYRGWVDLLYEDQGDTMRLHAGDCVIQPPEIRHRVCHASPEIEVIEIGVPAEHVTTIDHELTLPNDARDPEREWQGQKFVHHIKDKAAWSPWRMPGFTHRDTGIGHGTKGAANVQVATFDGGETAETSHDCDILFTFVMDGRIVLHGEGQAPADLVPGDAFVIPPGMKTRYADCSDDLELLEVSLPGNFGTKVHSG